MEKAALENAWVIEEFAYPHEPEALDETSSRWAFDNNIVSEESASEAEHASASPESVRQLQDDLLLAAERRGFAAGHKLGLEEGRAAEQEDARGRQAVLNQSAEAQRKEERAHLIETLDAARLQYMHEVEPEVVRLALAVAARILRREAQMDPLLLSGAVRVALGQLASSTHVKLKVPEGDLQLWREAIALVPGHGKHPKVVAGEGMHLGDCVIETELGSVDIGVRAQLSEIERGFFDRPGSRPTSVQSVEEEIA